MNIILVTGEPGDMGHRYSQSFIQVLRDTLRKVEQSSLALQNDPAMVEVKRQILRTIADLDIAKETAAS